MALLVQESLDVLVNILHFVVSVGFYLGVIPNEEILIKFSSDSYLWPLNRYHGANERRIEARCLTKRKGRIVRGWINYPGAAVLVILGVLLCSMDTDFPTAGTPILALPLIVAGLAWAGLTLRRQLVAPRGSGREDGHEDH